MDLASITPWLVLAAGGALGGNLTGVITRGGGGLVGRTLFGAIGGVAAGYAALNVPAVSEIAINWGSLLPQDEALSGRIAGLITGAIGGGGLGLVTGLLIRQSR